MAIVLRRLFVTFIIAVCAVLVPAAHGMSTDGARVALVIGNQHYQGEALANAANDARLMARTLAELGFSVTERYDLDRAQFAATVAKFAAGIPAGATALVYYAGHGMQISGSNYLNPVDMQITSETATSLRAYPLRTMLEQLSKAESAINIVVLDACRNNPFRPRGDVRYRSFRDLGLARVDAPRGTFIAYSTAPGQLAPDGTGSNSVYTETLARAVQEPGQDIDAVFKKVANEVRRKTLDEQIPWVESSLTGHYYFRPRDGAVASMSVASVPGTRQEGDSTGRLRYRGKDVGDASTDKWYRQMETADWNRIDWEIQQRVKRLTPDELPALEHKAGAGNVLAQTELGLAFRDGVDKAWSAPSGLRSGQTIRFKANNTKAWKWLRMAAQAGFPVAQTEIGEMYYAGHGVERDLQQSQLWLKQAAAADYPRAKLDLMQVQLESDPSHVDFNEALQSILKSMRPAAPPVSGPP